MLLSGEPISDPKISYEFSELALAYQEIKGAPDRSSAIVACALIDDALQKAICRRFIPDETSRDKFFDLDGGVSDFETKVKLGFLLGIYGDETRTNLSALGRIRNRFAHRPHIRSFDHEHLTSLFEKVTLYRRLGKEGPGLPGSFLPAPIKPDAPRRERFLTTAFALLSYFAVDPFIHAPINPFDPKF